MVCRYIDGEDTRRDSTPPNGSLIRMAIWWSGIKDASQRDPEVLNILEGTFTSHLKKRCIHLGDAYCRTDGTKILYNVYFSNFLTVEHSHCLKQ